MEENEKITDISPEEEALQADEVIAEEEADEAETSNEVEGESETPDEDAAETETPDEIIAGVEIEERVENGETDFGDVPEILMVSDFEEDDDAEGILNSFKKFDLATVSRIFEEAEEKIKQKVLPDDMEFTPEELEAEEAAEAAELEKAIEERDYRPIRTRRDGRTGLLGGIMYAIFILCISLILATLGWMVVSDVLALNADDTIAEITLPKDIFTKETKNIKDDYGNVIGTKDVTVADIDYVATTLKEAGLIEYEWVFKLFAKVSNADEKLAPGTYDLSTRYDYRYLVKNMNVGTGAMVTTTLTFPEGYTMEQIFQKLEDNDVCSKEDLYYAAANFKYPYRFLEDVEPGDASRLEGYIFPNTYDFYMGEQASSVINKFLSAMHYNITADMWKQCENLGITYRDAVTIASMIEKEAGSDDERARIASVIYNRLAAGMTLGLDSTLLYEYPDYDGSGITTEMLALDSPYNTHIYKGLTPTPICNPGMASINAALNPAYTGYYYFALNMDTGKMEFFTNYTDFNNFVATQNYDGQ